MWAKLQGRETVVHSVRFPILLSMVGLAIALAGCDSVKEQVGRDTFKPNSPTSDMVAVHVYLDQSGSAQEIRRDIGQQLQELLDLYPEAVETTVHYYGQKVAKQATIVSSKMNLSGLTEDYRKAPSEEGASDGTYIAAALEDFRLQCERNLDKLVIGVIGSDGGFEDDHSVLRKKIDELRVTDNARMLVFIGLDADNTTKLTTLDKVVRDQFTKNDGSSTEKLYFDITRQNGTVRLNQARDAILEEISAQKL